MKARPVLLQLILIGATASCFSGLSLADKPDQDSASTSVQWENDLGVAQKKARQQGKPILLLFTGTTWCGVCQLLEKNVLSKPEFAAYVKDRAILVKEEYAVAYFDTHPTTAPADSHERDLIELAKRFDVNVGQPNRHGLNGYPSLFLLSPDGKNIEHFNTNITVVQGSAESFVKSLDVELVKHAKELQPPATQPAESGQK